MARNRHPQNDFLGAQSAEDIITDILVTQHALTESTPLNLTGRSLNAEGRFCLDVMRTFRGVAKHIGMRKNAERQAEIMTRWNASLPASPSEAIDQLNTGGVPY